MAAKAHFCHWM